MHDTTPDQAAPNAVHQANAQQPGDANGQGATGAKPMPAAFFPTNRIGTLVAGGCILLAIVWLLVSSMTTASDRELLAISACARNELEASHFVTANPVVVTRRDLSHAEANCRRRDVALHQASVLNAVDGPRGAVK